MPTTYAHWAFGRECIEKMPENLQDIIHEYRDIYNLGVHGPDILFYDLSEPKICKHGVQMHNIPVKEFFRTCKKAFNTHEEKEQMLTYIMGFLTHFLLDSQVHGYVERKAEESGVSHNHVEAEWDRHLMELDGRVPYLVDRSESLKPNKKNTKIISYFYPFDEKTILRSCKMQEHIIHLVNAKSHRKQNSFQFTLRGMKQNDYADLFIGFEEDERCKDSNIRLDKLKNKALTLYSKLMNNLLRYLNGEEELIDYFDHDLSYWPNYKEIVVLPYEEELTYKV